MSSAISGSLNLNRAQTQISIDESYKTVQDVSKFDAVELLGHVFVDATADYRASIKLSLVKNGAGTYEVAASDIAGDDYSGSPIVEFQMSGSALQAKIPSGIPGFSSAYVKYSLSAPAAAGSDLSVDAANLTGTIASARLPEATSSDLGAVNKHPLYHVSIGANITVPNLQDTTFTNLTAVSNPDGAWNLTTGVFTVPSTGIYFISAHIFANPSSAGLISLQANTNTNVVLYNAEHSGGTEGTGVTLNGFSYLVEGDTIRFIIYPTTSSAIQIRSAGASVYSRFQIVKVNAS